MSPCFPYCFSLKKKKGIIFLRSACLFSLCRNAFSDFDAEIVANFTDKQMVSIGSEYDIDISRVRGVVDNSNRILEVKTKAILKNFVLYQSFPSILSPSFKDHLCWSNDHVFFFNGLLTQKKHLSKQNPQKNKGILKQLLTLTIISSLIFNSFLGFNL